MLIPAPTFAHGAPLSERPSVRRTAFRPQPQVRKTQEPNGQWSLTERLGSFFFDSPIGVTVVDRNYDILTINQAARQMLGIHGQGIGDDLVHLASGLPAQDLKGAIDYAFRGEMPGDGSEVEVSDAAMDEIRYLQLYCYPRRGGSVGRRGRDAQ